MIDLHCHILPGVDDGAATLEESLAMARLAAGDGIRTIVATPHLQPTEFAEHPWIEEEVARLQAAVSEEGLDLTILAGAEVPATMEVLEHLPALPRLGGGGWLLLEPPLIGLPNFLEELVFNMQLKGAKVALAHPERTQLIWEHPEIFTRLGERGCVLQITATSLGGRQDRRTRQMLTKLLREAPECVIASDAHDTVHRPPRLSPAEEPFRRLVGEGKWVEVTEGRPGRMVGR